jgi:hypothetical protein
MKDIKQTTDSDLYLNDAGDIVWAESTLQHQRDILLAHEGEYRLSPAVGVGASDYLDDEGQDNLKREINRQFTRDGMTVRSIDNNLNVIAAYE